MFNLRQKHFANKLAKLEAEKIEREDAFHKELRENTAYCNSQEEANHRIEGGTVTEHFGYVPNMFSELTDDELARCMKSVHAFNRSIPFVKESPMGHMISKYIEKWEKVFPNKDTSIADATKAALTDIYKEAAFRWDNEYRKANCSKENVR